MKNSTIKNPKFDNPRVRQVSIWRVDTEGVAETDDVLAAEEPLEIVLAFGQNNQRKRRSISITMRTPTGHDFELALGFLLTEGVISAASDVLSVRYTASKLDESAQTNVVQVDLHPSVKFDFERLNRHFYTSSSCGVCGKTSIEMVETASCFFIPKGKPIVSKGILFDLPDKLRAAQSVFDETGAIHAAALFDTEGSLLALREDVGRHNALDKLIGWAMQNNRLPLHDTLLLVSGRTSFELVQKAMMAGVSIIAAVGAPSSLAVELADDFGMTLIGFLSKKRFNVYSGFERVKME